MVIKDTNYVQIPGFARTRFDLTGNELIVYGLIFGFCQDGNSWYQTGLQYIADWCGLSSKIRAKEVVQRLIDKGVLERNEVIVNNVKFVHYRPTDMGYLKEIRPVSERDTNNTIYNNTPIQSKDCPSPKGTDTPDEEFERWYNLYGKKTEKQPAWRMWKRLTKEQKKEIFLKTPAYVASTPDIKYRMNPATYINPANKRWQDEVIGDKSQTTNHVWK